MKALTAAEMREVDRLTTERLGVPSLQLMENAGLCVAEVYWQLASWSPREVSSIVVLCGKGNNGGDGFVVARHLRRGRNAGDANAAVSKSQVRVLLFAQPEELRSDAATNFQHWRELGGEVVLVPDENAWEAALREIAAADVIIDAMFGTGFRGAASGPIGQAIQYINQLSQQARAARPQMILAVDTPSGLPSDGQAAEGPVLMAHHTVTFTAPKIGQLVSDNSDAVGALHVVNIGSPPSLLEEVGKATLRWAGPEEFSRLPLVRQSDGHKGLYGHILVVAGSLGKSGAAVMSGFAALSAGAGLVTVATPEVVLPIVAAAHPELMTEPLHSTDAGTASKENIIDRPALRGTTVAPLENFAKDIKFRFERIQEGKTVLAVGPGMGQHPETQEFVRSVVRSTDLPVILDADGLNAFDEHADKLRERNAKFLAVTPHPGEMARLLNCSTKEVQANRVKTARDAAQRWNAHVILKGAHTILASPSGQIFVNTTGNAGLAKGGSGDVLTGILAALTGQFKTDDWLRVLALGVYLHGVAADIAIRGTDPSGLLATEVARSVPHARFELLQELRRRA
jgi:ADP-dependent NAD(P)H-hydrate dehydratase / NAD(P)H-hydrate epimerase